MQVYKRKEYTQVYNVIILLQEYFPLLSRRKAMYVCGIGHQDSVKVRLERRKGMFDGIRTAQAPPPSIHTSPVPTRALK
jgi:hypothetical protein